jgi:hypothetical protein
MCFVPISLCVWFVGNLDEKVVYTIMHAHDLLFMHADKFLGIPRQYYNIIGTYSDKQVVSIILYV